MTKEIYSVYDLIADLELLIDTNPDVDFSELQVVLNCEYDCSNAELRTTGSGTFVNID